MIDNVVVLTEARLREMGLEGPACPFVLVIVQPQDPETPIDYAWFDTLDSVAAEVQRLKPKNLFTRTCGADVDIDCDELIRILRGGRVH